MQVSTPWQTLDDAKRQALACTECRLSQGRTHVVWMDGNPRSKLMLIGEAPGYHEDQQGKPFVGAAGKLLDNVLAGIGIDRTKCVICNVLKCRPPGNRDPMPDEIQACRPYLDAQIAFIQPRVIVTLGNFATRFILQRQVSISRVRGKEFKVGSAIVIPTFHPAAVLRGGGSETSPGMKAIRSDFRLAARRLESAESELLQAPVAAAPPPPLVEQASLF